MLWSHMIILQNYIWTVQNNRTHQKPTHTTLLTLVQKPYPPPFSFLIFHFTTPVSAPFARKWCQVQGSARKEWWWTPGTTCSAALPPFWPRSSWTARRSSSSGARRFVSQVGLLGRRWSTWGSWERGWTLSLLMVPSIFELPLRSFGVPSVGMLCFCFWVLLYFYVWFYFSVKIGFSDLVSKCFCGFVEISLD